ncbi:MAG: DNA mismatch repair endonuclease MutL [Spirochaetes bacterium]|nr:DNA mismatch repair endonuclease MutL [Spirochaetota bacterium]
MAGRIRILPDEVKHKIAAGEVVEGPHSILKELLENSLDAGAKNIAVEIEQGGMKRILVRDDGEGIYREDMQFITHEHATSKIQNMEDILAITTYGFRGEALSSIASISDLTIFSRRRDESIGARLVARDGKRELSEYMGQVGTTVIVENLFYTIPARKKFLKSQAYELRSIKEVFNTLAISRPDVSFTFAVDGKTETVLVQSECVRERITQIYGQSIVEHLIESELKDIHASIYAMVSDASFHRPNRSLQLLYVNGRPVEFKYLGFLLTKVYGSILQQGQHPVAFIFIEINPSFVDVNVHPAKKEVRFFDQNYINNLVVSAVRKALSGMQTVHGSFFQNADGGNKLNAYDAKHLQDRKEFELFFSEASRIPLKNTSHRLSVVNEEDSQYVADVVSELHVNVLFDSYLMVLKEDGIVLIDFHAAHERIIFDEILSKEKTVEAQKLLFPQSLDLLPDECAVVLKLKNLMENFGFEIEEIGKYAVVVRSVPSVGVSIDLNKFFHEIAEKFNVESVVESVFGEIREKIAERIACHAAFKSGDKLSSYDAQMIARIILSGKHHLRCPHGRPIVYRLGKKEIDRMFKRA